MDSETCSGQKGADSCGLFVMQPAVSVHEVLLPCTCDRTWHDDAVACLIRRIQAYGLHGVSTDRSLLEEGAAVWHDHGCGCREGVRSWTKMILTWPACGTARPASKA